METSPLICRGNQWTGLYMIETLVMKELRKALLLFRNVQVSFIELKLSRRKYASSSRAIQYIIFENTCPSNQSIFLNPQNLSILLKSS